MVMKLIVIMSMVFCMTALYMAQHWLWPNHVYPVTLFEKIFEPFSLLWLAGLLPGIIGLCGMLVFKNPKRLENEEPIRNLVCWRICTRGSNPKALAKTILRIKKEMAAVPLFPYVIEVVSERGFDFHQHDRLGIIVVPKDYQTPNGSRFKARALHYATFHSPISDNAWIMHLDEESRPTKSVIRGMARMIREEDRKEKPAIGQGAILYHRQWRQHPFLTLADNVRTGDDMGRFYIQHRIGITIFGLHGSFILARNDVEKKLGGFDFGPAGDVTEDAWWALVAMDNGYRSRWCDGYLEEQSCQSVLDFMRQRRRWWVGLRLVVMNAPVDLKWKLLLGSQVALWTLAPFALVYSFFHIFFGTFSSEALRFLANFAYSSFVTLYFVGLHINIKEGLAEKDILFKICAYILQGLMTIIPIFSSMEGLAILWAVFHPSKGFHVIKK